MAVTWIVETGDGIAGANTYYSLASVAAYCTARGLTAWASASTTNKDKAMYAAMDYIESQSYKGYKASYTYPLKWPRYDCWDDDGYFSNTTLTPTGVQKVPDNVKYAVAQSCYEEIAVPGCLLPTLSAEDYVTRKKIDVLEFEYAKAVPTKLYQTIIRFLNPYLKSKTCVDTIRT